MPIRDDRWPARHPLCTCPEVTFANIGTRDVARDREECRRRTSLGIDPHPVITCHDLYEHLKVHIRYAPEGSDDDAG